MEARKESLQEKIDSLLLLPSDRPSRPSVEVYIEQKRSIAASAWPKDTKGKMKTIITAIVGLAGIGEVLREVFKK